MASAPAVQYPKENEGPRILGATLAITTLALITMMARLFVRFKMIRNVGWDVSCPSTVRENDRVLISLGLHHVHGDGFGAIISSFG